jgi:hypothetical protein
MHALDYFHLEGTSRIPTIYRHTPEQLNAAIERAARHPDFYVLLHGIDAYMERRRRRRRAARMARAEALAWGGGFVDNEHMWGQS